MGWSAGYRDSGGEGRRFKKKINMQPPKKNCQNCVSEEGHAPITFYIAWSASLNTQIVGLYLGVEK